MPLCHWEAIGGIFGDSLWDFLWTPQMSVALESIPQGLKPALLLGSSAKAEALAYLGAAA